MTKPNILVIMSDQHNPHVTGFEGNETIRTPNLDRLAQEGVVFENAYCSSPLCLPSRSGFLTARDCGHAGVWSNRQHYMRSDIPTFAHSLNKAGYRTVLCGRMHIMGPDGHHGFRERIFNEAKTSYNGVPSGPKATGEKGMSVRHLVGPGRIGWQAYDQKVTDVCCEWLGAYMKTEKTPFAMVVGTVAPHPPWRGKPEYFEHYLEQVKPPELPDGFLESLHPAMKTWRQKRRLDGITSDEVARAMATYYAMTEEMDGLVGQIMEKLDETGLRENTIVVYTSDHGESLGENGLWGKSNYHDSSVRVPLIVSWPRQYRVNARVSKITSLLDVAPTILKAAGAEQLPDSQGRDLTPFLTEDGNYPAWPDDAVSEEGGQGGDCPTFMLREGPWKMVCFHGYDEPQLFNLQEDPQEFVDRAGDPSVQVIRDRMLARVHSSWDGARVEEEMKKVERARAVIGAMGSVPVDDIEPWMPEPEDNVYEGEVLPLG